MNWPLTYLLLAGYRVVSVSAEVTKATVFSYLPIIAA